MSRTTNSLRNAGTAMAGQLLSSLLRFVCRTVFLNTLGKEYLGISGLYANVLTILSISELGISTAITYSLYEPLARQDRQTVISIMTFFRRAYRVIALVILALGLALMPALPHLMTGVTDKVNIYQYYLLYLAQTVISYLFFSYKSILLIADQKKYAVDYATYACQTVATLTQVVSMLTQRSFLAYTLLEIGKVVMQNVVAAILTDRRYPWLRQKAPKLEPERKKQVFRGIYALFLNKLAVTVGTATDNLIISSRVSVVMLGLYNNYDMILAIVMKLLKNSFVAFTSSLGNLFATEDRVRGAFVFRCLDMLNGCLVAVCSVCFLCLFQPFIRLWAGAEYLLGNGVMVVIVLNFATNFYQNVVQIFREASGVFVRGKYRPLFTAVLNLGLSLILVEKYGIVGVFWGSIISRMVTAWWYDAWLLHRVCFHVSPLRYYLSCLGNLALTAVCAGAVEWLFRGVSEYGWLLLVGKGFVCVALTGGLCLLLTRRTQEFAYLTNTANNLLRKRKK